MFNQCNPNKYSFKNGSVEHYINIETPLTVNELRILDELLASFPDSNNSQSWPQKFLTLNFRLYPEKLLLIAANAYDRHGNTVLGADLNKPDDHMCKLPMHWAINNRLSFEDQDSDDAVAVLNCLLEHGAKTDILCYQDITPLEYAQNREFSAAARAIEAYNSCR